MNRCISLGLGGLVLIAQSAMTTPASACGPTPSALYRLLPEDGQVNVPTNAVLITASLFSPANIVLKRAGSGDAGTEEVLLDTDCGDSGEGRGAVCIATPREPLLPNTAYTWSAELVFGAEDVFGEEPNYAPTFTTGAGAEKSALDSGAVTVALSDYTVRPNSCFTSVATVVGESRGLVRPVVLGIAKMGPQYQGPPLVVTPNAPFKFYQYNMVDCITPEVIDFAGKRWALPEVCLPTQRVVSDAAATPHDAGAPEPAAPPRLHGVDFDDDNDDAAPSGGCAVSTMGDGSPWEAWALVVAAFGAGRLRRLRRLS